jgi:hypothetical protein
VKFDVVFATSRSKTDWAARLTDVAFVAGAGLLICSGYIHFDLWHAFGYRHIPTIGPLFLMQAMVALLIGLGVLAFRNVLVALLGAGFALATMAGFLVSTGQALFGFSDSWSAPFAGQAFGMELTASAVLLVAAALCAARCVPPSRPSTAPAGASSSQP